MRNLKRVLSLALSAIMLLGLMVMGAGAANVGGFDDADQISNVEAATITVGLEIFNGSDGNFMPNAIVDRGQMAAIICKILHGSDVNVNGFKGAGTFVDVPAWAEGYVNMCAGMGIVEGYDSTHFGANDPVLAWQASLMLQRALGYWDKNDPKEINKLSVTSEGQRLCKLYDGLDVGVDEPLTRDNVAVMVYNALFAQRGHYDDLRGLYTKDNDRNVVVNNGTVDPSNTLAQNTFGLYVVEGVVTANGYTSKRLSSTDRDATRTTVEFTDDTDLNQDGRYEYRDGDTYDFTCDTGLDLIGHAVKVYYTIERKAPVVYAITDQAALTAVIDYDWNTTRLADAANDAGFKKDTVLDIDVKDYFVNYDLFTTLGSLDGKKYSDGTVINTSVRGNIPDGKKLILISNTASYDVDCVILLDQYLDVVDEIDSDRTRVEYVLATRDGSDLNVPTYANVSKDEFVVVTDIGLQGKMLAFEQPTLLDANITRVTGISNTGADARRVIASGETYYESPVFSNNNKTTGINGKTDYSVTAFKAIKDLGDATLILDKWGTLIGLTKDKVVTAPEYAYVAQFGVQHSTGSLNTNNQLTAHVYFADGTNKICLVDEFYGATNVAGLAATVTTNRSGGNYFDTTALTLAQEAHFKTIDQNANDKFGNSATTGALGIWNVHVKSNGHVEISTANEEQVGTVNTINGGGIEANYAGDVNVRLIRGHSTFVDSDRTGSNANVDGKGTSVNALTNKVLYQNDETVYFYVDGMFNSDGELVYSPRTISVSTVTGVKNATSITNKYGDAGNDWTRGIQQVKAVPGTKTGATTNTRSTVGAVLIMGAQVKTTDIYYYNTGNYHIWNDSEGTKMVTFELFDLQGNSVEKEYKFSVVKDKLSSLWDGFYTAQEDGLEAFVSTTREEYNGSIWTNKTSNGNTVSNINDIPVRGIDGTTTSNQNYYMVNMEASYDEYTDNLFCDADAYGTIVDKPVVVDACGSGLDTVAKIVRALRTADNEGSVKLAYWFNTSTWDAGVIYVSNYDPRGTEAPGQKDPVDIDDLIVTEVEGKLYVTYNKTHGRPTVDEISAAIYAFKTKTDSTVTNVIYDATANEATVERGNRTTKQKVVLSMVATKEAVAGAQKLADAQNSVPTPYGTVTIEGNHMTATGADNKYLNPANGVNNTSQATLDLVNFLIALHDNGAQKIEFNGKTFVWDANMTFASKWKLQGAALSETIDGGANRTTRTLVTAVVSHMTNGSTSGTAENSWTTTTTFDKTKNTVTLTVDGAEIVLTTAYTGM